jgi:hypothetical protein
VIAFRQPPPSAPDPPFKPGDKVVCIDDTNWKIPDPGYDHLSPKKGNTYTVREYYKDRGQEGVSLMEGHHEHFYSIHRFKKA